MPIQVGDQIPSVELYENTPQNLVNIADICADGKVIIVAVPGAFTPTCTKSHLPAYIKKADEMKKQGVKEIICTSVNDPFVMEAWGRETHAIGKIRMLADPEAKFAKATDLTIDSPYLGGVRSKRYAMVVDHGKVKELNIEPDGISLTCSLPDKLKLK